MSNDTPESPQAFNWGITPRDPAVVAAEKAAAEKAAAEQEAARRAAGANPAAPDAAQPNVPPVAAPQYQAPHYEAPQYQAPSAQAPQSAPAAAEPADPFAIFTAPPTVQAPVVPPTAPPAAQAPPAAYPWESLPGPSAATPAAPAQPAPDFPWEAPATPAPAPAAEQPTVYPWETAAIPVVPESTSEAAPGPASAPAFSWDTPVVPAPEAPPAAQFPWQNAPPPSAGQQVPDPASGTPAAGAPPANWDLPTEATPYIDVPTETFSVNPEPQTYPWGDDVKPVVIAPDNAPTELFQAQASAPEGDVAPSSDIDALFSETKFVEYEDEPLLSQIPLPAKTDEAGPVAPRAPLSKAQKTLLWVAGGLVAALVLVGLFLVGTKIAVPAASEPTTAETPSTGETPEEPAAPVASVGPVDPGDYAWDALLGTECIDPFTSVWDENFTVVDCSDPHAAQLTAVGQFDDEADAAYPSAEDLGARIDELCTGSSVINFSKAKKYDDIQVSASYPATEALWDAGARTYYCFITRESGDTFKGDLAVAAESDDESEDAGTE